MTEVKWLVPVAAKHVFAVLADGWSYAAWVVGNSHIRKVDEGWPAIGTKIHHSVGLWPLQMRDETEVRAMRPERLIELHARLGPIGTAVVRLTLTPTDDGGTEVVMAEQAVSGPASLVPASVQAMVLRPRNKEALARLADLARGRAEAERSVQP